MPIKTRMKKSGRKRVYDQSDEGLNGQLNEAGRQIFRGRGREVTQGAVGLRDPLLRDQSGLKREKVQRLRRRRALASASDRPKKGTR